LRYPILRFFRLSRESVAKAGTQEFLSLVLGPRLRGDDEFSVRKKAEGSFPCRFPARLSNTTARGSQVSANTGIFAAATAPKRFFPQFTLTAGNGISRHHSFRGVTAAGRPHVCHSVKVAFFDRYPAQMADNSGVWAEP
jgi:hypothetical protein